MGPSAHPTWSDLLPTSEMPSNLNLRRQFILSLLHYIIFLTQDSLSNWLIDLTSDPRNRSVQTNSVGVWGVRVMDSDVGEWMGSVGRFLVSLMEISWRIWPGFPRDQMAGTLLTPQAGHGYNPGSALCWTSEKEKWKAPTVFPQFLIEAQISKALTLLTLQA